jgi:hypothetical protein
MFMSEHAARFIVARPGSTGPILELWSADETGDTQTATFLGHGCSGFARITGSTVAALVEGPIAGGPGRTLGALLIDDSDATGMSATMEPIASVSGDVVSFSSAIASLGDGVAAVVYAHRVNGQPFRALFSRLDGDGATTPIEFDNSIGMPAFTSGDYDIGALVRDGSDNHLVLGSDFEGATHRRQFIVPDGVTGALAPERDITITSTTPTLLGFHRRTTGDFLVGYVDFASTLGVRLDVMAAAALEAHDADSLPVVATLAPESIPNEADIELTENGLLLLGYRDDDPLGMRVIVVHRASGIRADQFIPFPDPNIFPANFSLERLTAAVTSDLLDTVFGGQIYVAFYLRDQGAGHDELYLGRLECTAR